MVQTTKQYSMEEPKKEGEENHRECLIILVIKEKHQQIEQYVLVLGKGNY